MSMKRELLNLPNMLTMFRIVLIPVACMLLALEDPLACVGAATTFGLAAFTDLFDGMIARARNLVTMTGKLLDPLADKLIVMAMLVVMVDLGWFPAWLVIVVVGREVTITGVRSIASSQGFVMAASSLGKYKTAFQLTGLSCLAVHYEYFIDFLFFESWVNFYLVGFVLFGISVVFSLWSMFSYFGQFYKAIDEQEAAKQLST